MMNMRTPDEFDLELVLTYLPSDFFESPAAAQTETVTESEINKIAFLMALFGWQGHKHERLGTQLGSVSCHACFRVLGLWLFKSKEVDEAGEEVTGAAMSKLDVVKEHREYCPWQNASSQNGQRTSITSSTSTFSGWETIIRILKNDHYLRTSGERQSLRASRQTSVDSASEDEEAKSARDAKDKAKWIRLRKVKSLFETKAKKAQRVSGTRTQTPPAT